MKVKTAAKINLALDVTGKRPDGYHLIESVFQTVGIYDEISIELSDKITLTCEKSESIPCGEENIVCKAAKLFFEESGIDNGCKIHLIKEIPSQAGMGGGSSDAAAVLYALNELTGTKLTTEKLAEIGLKLGADVPFFLTGGTAHVSGIGEKITPIADYSGKVLLIAKGEEGVSTAEAYKSIDSLENPNHPDVAALVRSINFGGSDGHKYFGNLFESAIMLTEVDYIRLTMMFCGAENPTMTGSGSAVFGLFRDEKAAGYCGEMLRDKGFYAQVCKTVKENFIVE